MIPYEYPDIFTGTAVQKELLITDGTVTVTDDEYTVSGETIKFETGDFELESFELSQSLMSEMQFTYGCCETGKVRFIVRKHYVNSIIGVELKVYIIPDHDASKMLQLGVFKVNEDKQSDNYNVHSITAYDAMYDILNEDVTDWYNDILEDETSSVTLATFRTSFISFFGLTTESASEPLYNDDLVLKRTIEKDQISGADIIKAICELNGCFGVINNVGEFRYKGLPPSIIHDASTLELDVPDYMDIQFEETSFKAIKKVKIVNENVTATSSQAATGNFNTYTIAYNPLIADYSQAQLQSLADDLCDLFYNHSYLPCTINAIGNPVHEVGDCLIVNTKYGFGVLTYIFERTLKGIQALRDTYRSNGVEYLSDNLNKQSTQTKAVQSQVSQMAQAYANSDTDFVETIRNIGFRLLDEPSNVSVEYDDANNEVSLKWTDPADIATNEPCPAAWAGTVVIRKEGSPPRHRWDGTLIEDSTTRDEYNVNALVDDTIEINKSYYYGIFPYDTKGDYRFTKVVSIVAQEPSSLLHTIVYDNTKDIELTGRVWGSMLDSFAYPETGIYIVVVNLKSISVLPNNVTRFFVSVGFSEYCSKSTQITNNEFNTSLITIIPGAKDSVCNIVLFWQESQSLANEVDIQVETKVYFAEEL